MNIYIAGRYSRREEFKKYAKDLFNYAIVVTSRWLEETGALDGSLDNERPEFHRQVAYIDLTDIDRAEAILFFC